MKIRYKKYCQIPLRTQQNILDNRDKKKYYKQFFMYVILIM